MKVAWETLLGTSDQQTERTLARMRDLVAVSPRDPLVVQTARRILVDTSRDTRDRGRLAAVLFGWLQEHFRYLPDPVRYELVQAPRRMLLDLTQTGTIIGDCDDAATLFASLNESVGIPTRFRVGGSRTQYQHVWVDANVGGGRWLSFDLTSLSGGVGEAMPFSRQASYGGTMEYYITNNGETRLALGQAPETEPPSGIFANQAPVGATGTGYPQTTKVDLLTGLTQVATAALPLLERYGVLRPTGPAQPARLPLPGEPRAFYLSQLYGQRAGATFGQVSPWVWYLVGGGLLYFLLLRR